MAIRVILSSTEGIGTASFQLSVLEEDGTPGVPARLVYRGSGTRVLASGEDPAAIMLSTLSAACSEWARWREYSAAAATG